MILCFSHQNHLGKLKTYYINFKVSHSSCQAELHVQPNGYGVWRYPVIFKATAPAPDDIIIIQAQQLTGETKKGFRLTSLTK